MIDTAPVLAIADTRVICAKADATLLLTRWRKTPFRASLSAIELLAEAGARIVGVALTQVNMKRIVQGSYGDRYAYSASWCVATTSTDPRCAAGVQVSRSRRPPCLGRRDGERLRRARRRRARSWRVRRGGARRTGQSERPPGYDMAKPEESISHLEAAVRACRRHFLAAAMFSALVNILYLAPTLYMLQVYDRVVPTRGVETLVFLTPDLRSRRGRRSPRWTSCVRDC